VSIRYTYRRSPGGRRYDASDRASARIATLEQAPQTDTFPYAVAAMTSPDGIETVVDVSFEIESNRLRRDTTAVTVKAGPVDANPNLNTYAGDPNLLSSGRYSPSRRYAIADSEAGRLDDGAVTYDPVGSASWSESEKPAAAFSNGGTVVVGRATALNGDASIPNPASGRGKWVTGRLFTNPVYAPAQVAVPSSWMLGATGRYDEAGVEIPTPFAAAWRVDAGTTKLSSSVYGHLWSDPNPCQYVIPASGSRTFTIVCYAVAKDGAVDVNFSAYFGYSTGGGAFVGALGGRVPARGGVAVRPTRLVATLTVEAPPGTILQDVQPQVGFESTTGTGIEISGVQIYAGPARPDAAGELAATPVYPLTVTTAFYSDTAKTLPSIRRVNRVDVAGELRASKITAARVEVEEVAGTWILAGTATGTGGRLSVPLARTYDARRVRAVVEEVATGEGGVVYVTELDPRLVEDVSNDVESLDLEWSRETAPGSATSPVGNSEASTLSLTLDDTVGKWNPARNASLDVGHAIEVATGIRYSNFLVNPTAETNLDGWTSLDPMVRMTKATGLDDAAPASTAIRSSQANPTRIYSPLVFAAPGFPRVVGQWIKVEGTGVGSYVELAVVGYDNAAGSNPVVVTPAGQRPRVMVGTGWQYVTRTDTLPGGKAFAGLQVEATIADLRGNLTVTITRGYHGALNPDGSRITFEEMFPAGVFYSEPYETSSDATTVTIEAIDKLARLQSVAVDEPVRVGQNVGRIVRDLALRVLDFDEDQIAVHPSSGSYVIPYAYASGGFGSYVADLAKATLATLGVDALERLVLAPRSDVSAAVAAEIRADNALISFKRPPAYDVTASVVTVNASPLTTGPLEDLWGLPAGGVTIPANSDLEVVAPYGSTPAVNAYVGGLVHDKAAGTVVVTTARLYSDRAILTLRNNNATTATVADVRVSGTPLVEQPLSARRVHEPSRRRYGERELTVDAKLVQTQNQVDVVAAVLLDTFRGVDDAGVRRLPDLSFAGLGLLHVTAVDRVVLSDSERFVGGEYAVLARKLVYSEGAILLDDVRVREASTAVFAVADTSKVGGGGVAGY
jgi:hypothetical protein